MGDPSADRPCRYVAWRRDWHCTVERQRSHENGAIVDTQRSAQYCSDGPRTIAMVVMAMDVLAGANRVEEVQHMTPARFESEIVPAYRPVVLRGLVSDWPAVAASSHGPRATADYIRRFDGGRPAKVFAASPHVAGRFFYSDDHSGYNFKNAQVMLPLLLDALVAE
ncbi:MAG: hypothetical protein EOP89_07565, partial [Lysobacteraceae bacterium]